MKLLIHPQTSLVQPLKFGNRQIISSHTLLNMWLLIHIGIKVNLCQWKNTWCHYCTWMWNVWIYNMTQCTNRFTLELLASSLIYPWLNATLEMQQFHTKPSIHCYWLIYAGLCLLKFQTIIKAFSSVYIWPTCKGIWWNFMLIYKLL